MAHDFVIVGAGFVGLSTAYWLSELAPGSRIRVVDISGIGAGASGKNAGFLTKGSAFFYHHLIQRWGEEKALSIFNFSKTSIELLHERILSSSAIDHSLTSSLTLYRKSKPELPKSFGFEEVSSPYPSQSKGALKSEGEFSIKPQELLNGLYQHLCKKGVSFDVGGEKFQESEAEKTIYCLNAYTSTVLPEFNGRIEPRRAQMLRVRLKTDSTLGSELCYDPEERVYFRREGKNHFLIGGKRLLDSKNEETLIEENSSIIQGALASYLTKLGMEFDVIDRWSGIMGFTESELPILEDQGSRLILAGFSGHGMGLGFHSGKMAAEICTGRKTQQPF